MVTTPGVAGKVSPMLARPPAPVTELAALRVPPVVVQLMVIPGALTALFCAKTTSGAGNAVLVGAVWPLPDDKLKVRIKVAVTVKVAMAVPSSARVAVTVTGPTVAGRVRPILASPPAPVTELAALRVPPVVVQLMVTPGALTALFCAKTTSGAGNAVLVGAVWPLPDDTAKVRIKVAVTVKVAMAVPSSERVAVTVTGPTVAGSVSPMLARPPAPVIEVAALKVPPVVVQLMVTPGAFTALS